VRSDVVQPSVAEPTMIGRSAVMQNLLEAARRAGMRNAKVLITGESGVGKDVLGRFIHSVSPRAARPFVALNCAGIAENLLESELFGHVKGSFTGAYRDKPGKLQQAHGGTIFLDEVGEMTPRMQALLLRFLESGEVQPVGADVSDRKVDARVVAATNRDLDRMTLAGTFREDLLYRIRVVHLHVPPLRERVEDIRPLLTHFLLSVDPAIKVSEDAWRLLESHHWPGNVREVQNVAEQIGAAGHAHEIGAADLPTYTVAAPELQPRGADRRREHMDVLFESLRSGTADFWQDVHDVFMDREMTRQDVRHLVERGLAAADGSYREMLQILGLRREHYKRLLNFLVRHGCAVDFRPYRPGGAAASGGGKAHVPMRDVGGDADEARKVSV
jgi:transcriptional regulator with PAS, ATPase and Fis domain